MRNPSSRRSAKTQAVPHQSFSKANVASGPRIVRLGVTDLSFHRATAAVVAIVMQRMGLTVERRYALHEVNFRRLREGSIDMLASAWLPFSHGIYKQAVDAVAPTRELGLHYQPYAFWGVPDYVNESEVASIEDLFNPEVRSRMHPVIQGIGLGAGITRFSMTIMEKYGLRNAGYQFRTGTQDECIEAFEALYRERRWGIVPLWHPHFLHHRYRIRNLKDPKGLLGSIDRAVLLAREDRLALLTSAEIQVLDNIRLSNLTVSELDDAFNRGDQSADNAANDWLARHPEILSAWLKPLD